MTHEMRKPEYVAPVQSISGGLPTAEHNNRRVVDVPTVHFDKCHVRNPIRLSVLHNDNFDSYMFFCTGGE